MNPINIGSDGKFSLGGENFVIEGEVPSKDRRASTSEAFTIVKSEPYLRVYEELASAFSPSSILELGILGRKLRLPGQAIQTSSNVRSGD